MEELSDELAREAHDFLTRMVGRHSKDPSRIRYVKRDGTFAYIVVKTSKR